MSAATKGDLVVVWWFDTVEDDRWHSLLEIESVRPTLCKHVGWLFEDTGEYVKLLTSVSYDLDASYVVIPKATVKKIEKIRDDEIEVEL